MILGPKYEISRPNKYTDWSKQVDWGMGFCPPNRLRLKWIAPNKHWELDIWYGFPKMGDSNMWIGRGITTPWRWDLGFPTNNGFSHFFLWFSYGFPMGFPMFLFHTFHQGPPGIFWCTWSSAASPRATSSPPLIRRQDRMINMLPGRMVNVYITNWKISSIL